VNAVELKRSIIEAGDVIELGDVRFKFVGAGQVFVPGPNESQQLTAISDREAELADPRRKGWGGYALPIVGAGVVGALIILGFVYFLRTRAQPDPLPNGQIGAATDNEQALVMEAKKACTADDCDAAYASVASLPEKSPWRDSIDFKQIEALWAESMFKKARALEEVGQKRLLLGKVAAARTLDDAHRKQLAAELAALDEPAPVPTPVPPPTQPVATRDPAPPTSAVAPPTASVRPNTPPHPTSSTGAVPPTAGTSTTAKPSGVSVLDRARAAALDGRAGEVRALLGARVRSGAGTPEEVRLVKGACQSLGDMACIEDIKRHP
jgi:hypothetical protein